MLADARRSQRIAAEAAPTGIEAVATRVGIHGGRVQRGFTLVELVMVIVLTGILAVITSVFIVEPMRAYVDQSRRSALVDDADLALRRMAREIRAAIPNSVQVVGSTLTFYNAVSGARYRTGAKSAGYDAAEVLEFDRDDEAFEVLGGFSGVAALSSNSHQLVIYNLGTADSNLYDGAGVARPVISPAGTTVTINGDSVTLDPAFRFGWQSPEQRVFLTDGPVSYDCIGGLLTRNGVTVVDGVSSCSFGYAVGTGSAFAIVSLSLSLSRDGESVTLLRQVHVENLP